MININKFGCCTIVIMYSKDNLLSLNLLRTYFYGKNMHIIYKERFAANNIFEIYLHLGDSKEHI